MFAEVSARFMDYGKFFRDDESAVKITSPWRTMERFKEKKFSVCRSKITWKRCGFPRRRPRGYRTSSFRKWTREFTSNRPRYKWKTLMCRNCSMEQVITVVSVLNPIMIASLSCSDVDCSDSTDPSLLSKCCVCEEFIDDEFIDGKTEMQRYRRLPMLKLLINSIIISFLDIYRRRSLFGARSRWHQLPGAPVGISSRCPYPTRSKAIFYRVRVKGRFGHSPVWLSGRVCQWFRHRSRASGHRASSR